MFSRQIMSKSIVGAIIFCSFQAALATPVIELITPPRPHYPDQNPKVEWTFRFAKAMTLIEADIQDIKRIPVASLLPGRDTIQKGDTQFVWTPGDKEHDIQPDGVYFLKLTARDGDGVIHEFPGSEEFLPFGLGLDNFEIDRQMIRFDNPRRGLVTVRIGYGPGQKKALCASPVNWEFMSDGRHTIQLKDGLFDRRIDMSQISDLLINASCYPLPEGSFKLAGGRKASDREFELTLNETDLLFMHDANRYRYDIARGDFELIVDARLVRNEEDTGYRLLFTVSADQAPVGWLDTPGLIHEVKVFIDDRQVYLSQVATFPFSDEIRFNVLTPGDHMLVINAWDYSNRFGYWTGILNPDDVR